MRHSKQYEDNHSQRNSDIDHKHQFKSAIFDTPHHHEHHRSERGTIEEPKLNQMRDFKKNTRVWNPRNTAVQSRNSQNQEKYSNIELHLGLISSSFDCKSLYKYFSVHTQPRVLDQEAPDLSEAILSTEGSRGSQRRT